MLPVAAVATNIVASSVGVIPDRYGPRVCGVEGKKSHGRRWCKGMVFDVMAWWVSMSPAYQIEICVQFMFDA